MSYGEFDPEQNPYAAPQIRHLEASPFARQDFDDDLGEFSPFKTIWTSPRRTIRQIVRRDPNLHVFLLVSLAGVGEVLDNASMRNAGDNLSMIAILILAVVLGPVSGLISWCIGSLLIRWTGTWIGGVASWADVRCAMAWSNVPVVVALVLWIPQLLLFGSEMFTSQTPRIDNSPVLLVPLLGIAFFEIVLAIWSFVLLCNTIAEVQGYRSAWKGLGNMLLAGLVLFIPLMILVLGIVLLFLKM